MTDVAGVARGYDAAGNTTSIGGTAKEFVYSPGDRLSQFKQTGVIRASYRYNGRGERVATTGTTTSTIDTYTLYDEEGNWIGDYDTTGAAKQQAVWFGSAPVGLVIGSGAAQTLAYVQPDHLGTPRAVIDPARNVAIWTWDAKSEVFGNSPPNQDPDLDGTAFVFNMRFPGQRYDDANGLLYNYFRDYDPSVGRYVQSDPIGLSGGISTYLYGGAEPLSTIDYYGLEGVGQWTIPQKTKDQQRLSADAWAILSKTHQEMKQKNVPGTDQFFHCLAACRATKQTGDQKLVLDLMNNKEYRDYALNVVGKYGNKKLSHDEMVADMARDQQANRHGASCPKGQGCNERCSSLLNDLAPKRRPFMSEYRKDWK